MPANILNLPDFKVQRVEEADHPHEPPGPPKNYGADINTLIELLESGRL